MAGNFPFCLVNVFASLIPLSIREKYFWAKGAPLSLFSLLPLLF
jgi:hypothetical protein